MERFIKITKKKEPSGKKAKKKKSAKPKSTFSTIKFNENKNEWMCNSYEHKQAVAGEGSSESSLFTVPHFFTIDNLEFPTVDHYWYYKKYGHVGWVKKKIFQQRDTDGLKRLCEDMEAFEKVSDYQLVEYGTFEKFHQIKALGSKLLKTGDTRLEYDSVDEYWGTGKLGKGQNKLGEILQKVRYKLNRFSKKKK